MTYGNVDGFGARRRDLPARALPCDLERCQPTGEIEIIHEESVGRSLAKDLPRSCGDCRLCCKLLAVQEIKKPRGEWCKHACKSGCAVYETRPQQCRDFACLWLLASHPEAHERLASFFPADERPDRLRVVVTPFLGGVRDPRSGKMLRAVALHEGAEGVSRAAKLIRRLCSAGFAVLHNSASRCLGCWFPDGAYFKMPADHPDAKLFDRTTASPEEVAHVDRLETEAQKEIDDREAGRGGD